MSRYATRQDYAQHVLEVQAERVRGTLEGARNDTLHAACCILARYVQDGALTEQQVQAAMLPAAMACGLEVDGAVATIRSGLRPWTDGKACWYPPLGGQRAGRVIEWKGQRLEVAPGQRVVEVATGWAEDLPARPAEVRGLHTVFYGGLRRTKGEAEILTLEQVQATLEQPEAWPADGKDALPLWHFVEIEGADRGRKRTGEGASGRPILREPTVSAVHAVMLDYDTEQDWSLEWVHQRMGHLTYLAHTSASHGIGKRERQAHGRGRVILPLARPVTEDEYDEIARYLAACPVLGAVAKKELQSPRRAYYVPARAPGGYAQRSHLTGHYLDPDAMLARAAEVDSTPEINGGIWDLLELQGGEVRRAKDTGRNLHAILTRDPTWAGRIRRDAFAGRTELDGAPLADEDLSAISLQVAAAYGCEPATYRVAEIVALVAREHAYHPVQEYLHGLTWDGVARLDSWVSVYLSATSPGADVYGAKWLIGAVARVMDPGCKLDTVPVLIGGQGAGKSRACKALGGEWFRDSALDIGGKDGYSAIRGAWIYELAELDSVTRREWSTVKAYLSAQSDTYRPAYGRSEVTVQRQVAFVATTNEGTFLSDSTGSRRFWPIVVGRRVDVAGVRRVRDQLWAEALHAYRQGRQWHLSTEEEDAREEQSAVHEIEDSWAGSVRKWLAWHDCTTIAEVLEDLHVHVEHRGPAAERRVARLLSAAGWTQIRVQRDGQRARAWVAPQGWVVRPPPAGGWSR